MSDESPFVRFGLDPSAPLAALTERMRELAEDASDEERAALRAAWEAITRSPATRYELVLRAGPAPEPLAVAGPAAVPAREPWPEPRLLDVLGPGSLQRLLGPETERESELRAPDLAFLVRADEIDVTGPLGPRRER